MCALFNTEVKHVEEPNKAPTQIFVKNGEYDPNFKPF